MNISFLPVLFMVSAALPMASAADVAAPAAADEETAYLQIGQDTVALLRELTAVLDSVKDRESADAAVSRVHDISAKMQALKQRVERMPKPEPGQEAILREHMNNEEVRSAVQQFMAALLNLAQTDAYGSEELITALTRMVSEQM